MEQRMPSVRDNFTAVKTENAMTIEQLRNVHRAKPFVPFTIYLADGRSHGVPHPECMMFSHSGRTVVVASPDDTFDILDLLLVTDLKVHAPASAQSQGS